MMQGNSKTRGVLLGLVVLLLLSFGGLVIYLKNMDFNAYKPLLKRSVFEAIGRNLDIDGDVELKLSLHPLLIMEGLHLANVRGGSRANMINIQRMEIQLSLRALFDHKLDVDRIVLVAPDIWLETLQSGVNNWAFKPEAGQVDGVGEQAEAEPESLLIPHINRLLMRDAKLTYRDGSLGDDVNLQLPTLEMAEFQMEQRPNETRFSIQARGEVNHHAVQFSGVIDDFPRLLANQTIQLSAFQADMIGVHTSFSGSIKQPLDAQGFDLKMTFATDSVMQVASVVDLSLPRDFPLTMQLSFKDATDGFHFSKLRAKIADSDISGQLVLNLMGERPAIDGVLYSTSFDVTRFVTLEKKEPHQSSDPKQTTKKKHSDARLFSKETIDVSFLQNADVSLALKVKKLTLAEFEVLDLDTKIDLKDGMLALNPLALGIAGGTLTGSLKLASERSSIHLSSVLHLSNIHPSVLLAVKKGEKALIEGAMINADIRFSGRGKSIAEMMAHGDGVLLVKLDKGRIQSKALRLIGGDVLMNVANTLNPFSEKMSYNALQCGVIHFRLKDGDMSTHKGIVFETDRMNIISSGHVNLASEKIDLSISTETREGLGLNVTNMVNVVKLGGTLMQPGVGVDVMKTGMVAARTVGAFATGGLSLLGESLLNRVIADSTPCETALKMAH